MVKTPDRTSHGRPPAMRDRKTRDFASEYARRIERGLASGKTRSQARGHPRAGERPKPAGPQYIQAKQAEEQAIRMIAKGSTLRAAAREHGLREERLRRYLKENVGHQRTGRRWQIVDTRPRQFPFYSEGRLVSPVLTPEAASEASKYMGTVFRFLSGGARKVLAPFNGRGVADLEGHEYLFETDPYALYELDAAGELSFPELYNIVT